MFLFLSYTHRMLEWNEWKKLDAQSEAGKKAYNFCVAVLNVASNLILTDDYEIRKKGLIKRFDERIPKMALS